MNKVDTMRAKETPLTERSPYLWNTVPTFWNVLSEDGAENPFLPNGWVADSEDAMVCANFSFYPIIFLWIPFPLLWGFNGPIFSLIVSQISVLPNT